jgi:hypothetical protein
MIDCEVRLWLFVLSHGLLQADEFFSIGGTDGSSGVLFWEKGCLFLDSREQDRVLFEVLHLMHHNIRNQEVYLLVCLEPRPRKMSLLRLAELQSIYLLFKL